MSKRVRLRVCAKADCVCMQMRMKARVKCECEERRRVRTASMSQCLGQCRSLHWPRVGGLRHGPVARNQAAKFRVATPGTHPAHPPRSCAGSRFGSLRPTIVRSDSGHRIADRKVAQVTAGLCTGHRISDTVGLLRCLYMLMFIDTRAASYHRRLSSCSRHPHRGGLTAC